MLFSGAVLSYAIWCGAVSHTEQETIVKQFRLSLLMRIIIEHMDVV